MSNDWESATTDYPAVRLVLDSDHQALNDEAVEALLDERFPGTDPAYIEDFMRTMQEFGRQAAPILQTVGPGMAQGAMAGSSMGPYGALFGALAGGASSLLSSGGRPGGAPAAATPKPPSAAPAASTAGALPPVAQGGSASAAASGASAQLLTLLSRPETMQALLAMLMPQAGRTTVPVGRHDVPASAFANAIAELAAGAADAGEESEDYWYDRRGQPRCDLASPNARAYLVMTDLLEATAEEAAADAEAEEESEAWEEEMESDAIESFESALRGEYRYDG